MAYTVFLHGMNAMRGSTTRASAEQTNAVTIATLSRALTAGGAAIATTTSKVKSAAVINYTIKGQLFTKAATDNLWTPTGANVGPSLFQKYLLLLDGSGNATVQEAVPSASAANVVWTNVSQLSRYAPLIQVCSDTKCIVGGITVATNASTTFIPGTTALNAAGITTTYLDGMDQSILPLLADSIGNIVGNGG